MLTTEKNKNQAPLLPEGKIELSAIIHTEKESIWVQPICDFFKIRYDWQLKVIKSDPILSSIQWKNTSELLFNDKRQRVLLPKKGFLRWVQIINPNTINPDLRPKFIQFQADVFDFLYGAAEKLQEESELYRELKQLQQEKAAVTTRIKQVQSRLSLHWNERYGQAQLQFANNIPDSN